MPIHPTHKSIIIDIIDYPVLYQMNPCDPLLSFYCITETTATIVYGKCARGSQPDTDARGDGQNSDIGTFGVILQDIFSYLRTVLIPRVWYIPLGSLASIIQDPLHVIDRISKISIHVGNISEELNILSLVHVFSNDDDDFLFNLILLYILFSPIFFIIEIIKIPFYVIVVIIDIIKAFI